jgi:exodeoxyribonuclease V beta subunit
MKGFIDLVFEAHGRYYLADYKSNWLGNTPEAYRVEALRQVMAQEMYSLQYLIYTLAVHRYLQLRLPGYDYNTHFGGVVYLFIRGIDPAFPTAGIFRDRPARALVEALDSYLVTGLQRS